MNHGHPSHLYNWLTHICKLVSRATAARSTRLVNLTDLPSEILDNIVQHVPEWENWRGLRETCHVLLHHSERRHLRYVRVALPSWDITDDNFEVALKVLSNAKRAAYVKELSIEASNAGVIDIAHYTLLKANIPLLKNLKSLSLENVDQLEASFFQSMTTLKELSLEWNYHSLVRHLPITALYSRYAPDLASNFHGFSQLRYAVLYDAQNLSIDADTVPELQALQLYYGEMHGFFTFRGNSNLTLLSTHGYKLPTGLGESCPRLRHLRYYTHGPMDRLELPHLETLELPMCAKDVNQFLQKSDLSQLRHLYLELPLVENRSMLLWMALKKLDRLRLLVIREFSASQFDKDQLYAELQPLIQTNGLKCLIYGVECRDDIEPGWAVHNFDSDFDAKLVAFDKERVFIATRTAFQYMDDSLTHSDFLQMRQLSSLGR